MHGGFGGGGGGYGHSGGGGGHSGGGHHSSGGHSGGHNSGHSGGGHAQPMAHDGGHPMHADHHHHASGNKDDKGGGAKGQGQSLLSHATSLVQNGHGVLGAIAQALSGHTTTGHGAGAGQSMHLDQYLSPLQAEKKDSSDQVGNPGALSHPDNLVQNGMVSRRTHNEPRIVLAAIFGGLLIWMLVVQIFSGGPPVHKRVAYNPLQQRSLPQQDAAQDPSVAPLLSILSMAESHSPSSGIGQVLKDSLNSDTHEATQTDSSAAPERDARESSDNDSRYEKEQADLRNESPTNSPADSETDSDSSAQLALAMQIFQPRATAGAGTATQSAMVAPAASNPLSMRTISQGAPAGARMTARPMGNRQPALIIATAPAASNLLQAETLQKSAQETFAAGTFGGPRSLSSDEPISVGTQPKVPAASSVLRMQQPSSAVSVSHPQPLLSAAPPQSNPAPDSFASLFVPADHTPASAFRNDPTSTPTRRRWRASQVTAQHNTNSARNSTIADASIYTNSPVDELGHSRKRVVTDR